MPTVASSDTLLQVPQNSVPRQSLAASGAEAYFWTRIELTPTACDPSCQGEAWRYSYKGGNAVPAQDGKGFDKDEGEHGCRNDKAVFSNQNRNVQMGIITYESTRLWRWNFRMSLWRCRLIPTSQENARHRALDRDM